MDTSAWKVIIRPLSSKAAITDTVCDSGCRSGITDRSLTGGSPHPTFPLLGGSQYDPLLGMMSMSGK